VNASLDYRWKGHIPSECSLIQDKAIGAIIQKEVVLHFHGAQICDEILFSGCPSNCIAMAAFALRTNIVPNYTYIYRKGELGLECYLLSKGDALHLDDDNTVVNELPCGDMFGEMAVITHQETHYREEDIFALTYCELETLTLQDFDKICKAFPVLESNAKILMEIMRRDHDNHRDQWDRYRDQLKGEFEKVQNAHHENVVKVPGAGGHGGHGDEHGGHGDEHGGHDEHHATGMPYIPDWVFTHKEYVEARAKMEASIFDGSWFEKSSEASHGHAESTHQSEAPPPAHAH